MTIVGVQQRIRMEYAKQPGVIDLVAKALATRLYEREAEGWIYIDRPVVEVNDDVSEEGMVSIMVSVEALP